jgi:hypothetical protein
MLARQGSERNRHHPIDDPGTEELARCCCRRAMFDDFIARSNWWKVRAVSRHNPPPRRRAALLDPDSQETCFPRRPTIIYFLFTLSPCCSTSSCSIRPVLERSSDLRCISSYDTQHLAWPCGEHAWTYFFCFKIHILFCCSVCKCRGYLLVCRSHFVLVCEPR